jgi:outer membrane protein assembly factor BamB
MHRMNHGLQLAALLATAAWLGGTTGAWATGPAIALSPTENHPNSTVQVLGNGFSPYAAVDIYFDSTDEALAIANSAGKFAKIPVPVSASALPGTHYISAVQRSNGEGAQKAFTVNTDWAEFHFNPKLKGLNPWENILTPNNVSSLDVAWTFTTSGLVHSSPSVVGGIVYVASEDEYLYALNATTGALLWSSIRTGGEIDSSPAVANGVVYVGSGNNNLYAFDATTGAVLWTAAAGGPIVSSPAVANGVVYVGSDDEYLYAINASTGATLWTSNTGGAIRSSPAVANGVVYVGSEDDKLYAFNATTGATLWTAATGGSIASSPAVANGVVYVGSDDSNLYAFNATTGDVVGSILTGGQPIDSSPALANDVVYVGSNDDMLYAFNATTGAPLWTAITGGQVNASPAVSNGMVYVGSYDDNLYAYALNGGNDARYRGKRKPPAISSLHPDWSLKPAKWHKSRETASFRREIHASIGIWTAACGARRGRSVARRRIRRPGPRPQNCPEPDRKPPQQQHPG